MDCTTKVAMVFAWAENEKTLAGANRYLLERQRKVDREFDLAIELKREQRKREVYECATWIFAGAALILALVLWSAS